MQARTEFAADVASEALHEADFLGLDHPQAARRPEGEQHERRRPQQAGRRRADPRRAVFERVFDAVDRFAPSSVQGPPAGDQALDRTGQSGDTAPAAFFARGHRASLVEQADAVQDDQQGGGLVDDRRGGWRQQSESGKADGDEVDAEGEDQDAAADPGHHSARVAEQGRQIVEPVGQQDDLRRLGRKIGGAVADRDADGRGRQRGRVVDPVADHQDVAVAAGEFPELPHLLFGKQLRLDLVNAGPPADRARRRLGVAGQHDDRIDTGLAEVADRARGLVAQRIGEGERAGERAVDRDGQPGLAGAGLRDEAFRHGAEIVLRHYSRQQRLVAHHDLVAVHGCRDTTARVELEVLRFRELDLPLPRLGDEGPAQQVLRGQFSARRELKQASLVHVRDRRDPGQRRTPAGQRARLVEHAGVDARQRLDHVAALDQCAFARQPGDRRSHRRRRREHQGARAGDDQGRHRAHHLAGEEVDANGSEQHRGQEEAGQLVRGADHPGAPALRVLDQVGDPGDGRVAAGPFGANLEHAVLVQAAAPHRVADAELGRQRFAGHAALVDGRLAALDHPVHRHPLAGEHPHEIADLDFAERHEFLAAVAKHPRLFRLAGDETGDRPLGAIDRPVFDPLADQHDEHDLGRGEVLPDPYRRARGDRDRQVRREVPLEQVQDRVADERIARDQCEDQRQVDAGDRADDSE